MKQAVDASRLPELRQLIEIALAEAVTHGADQAEADASLQQGLNVSVRLGEVETIEYQRDRALGITVYVRHAVGLSKGSASSADFKPESVRAMVAKACEIAQRTAADPCAGLAEPSQLAKTIPDLDLNHPWSLTPEAAIDLARDCEAAGRAIDTRLSNSEGAAVSSHRGVRVYGNSHGFLAGYPSTSHSISCALLAQQGEEMQRDYWYSAARSPDRLDAAAAVGRRAGERALARLGARSLATTKAPVLFAPEMARGFWGHLIAAVRGTSQYRKSSFLLDAVGQQVLPPSIQLQERPHLPQAMASAPFDGEGVATRDSDLVTDGILQRYVLSTYSARKLGLTSTGNAGGVHNLLVQDRRGAPTLPALLQQMGRGLYVTELMGQGINGVTGDYSRGAAGFWVENGQLSYPVNEITIAGNLRQMLSGVVAVGGDVDIQGAIRTGSVLIDEMVIAGN